MKLGIIGKGFVGSSVSNGFDVYVEQYIVDPKHNDNTLEGLIEYNPPITFICVPTPQQETHLDVDVHIARQVLTQLDSLSYAGVVVIKSTITPQHLTKFKEDFNLRIVYNPEFLTEANAHEEFLNPHMQILGGELLDCVEVEQAYITHSRVKIVPTFKTDLTTASLIKYSINSWLATKVTFFNDMFHLHQSSNAETSWEQFTDMLKRDPRMGNTHMQVPGPDGEFGFGGHCLPKDTKALLYYSKMAGAQLELLKSVIEQNNKIR